MKKYIKLILLVGVLLSTANFNRSVAAPASVAVSFQLFYDNLSPYGVWVSDPGYGYVWVPDVSPGFRPYYTSGYWVVTDYGSTWVSSYPWGWAPFHYGRWTFDPFYGWVWVPGTEWGPAWVVWRTGGDYYGWSPMTPGVSLSFAFSNSYYVPYDYWVFVPQRYVLSTSVSRYYVGVETNQTILARTSIVDNTYRRSGTTYVAGPRASELTKATGQRVTQFTVNEAGSPSKGTPRGNEVAIYKPEISQNGSGAKVAPAKFVKAEKAIGKPASATSRNGKPQQSVSELKEQMVTSSERISPKENSKAAPVKQENNKTTPAKQENNKTAPVKQENNKTAPAKQENKMSPAKPPVEKSAPAMKENKPKPAPEKKAVEPKKEQPKPAAPEKSKNAQPAQREQAAPSKQSKPEQVAPVKKQPPAQQQPQRQQAPKQNRPPDKQQNYQAPMEHSKPVQQQQQQPKPKNPHERAHRPIMYMS